MQEQEGDVLIFQTNDEGDINVEDGLVEMSGGLESMMYLSLFGGNEEDSGQDATAHLQYWGNFNENLPERQYRSETQFELKRLAVSSASLRPIELAAKRDLNDFVQQGIADEVTVVASIPGLNKIKISTDIIKDGTIQDSFDFIENWKVDANGT
jgi:phage gp46-like protein